MSSLAYSALPGRWTLLRRRLSILVVAIGSATALVIGVVAATGIGGAERGVDGGGGPPAGGRTPAVTRPSIDRSVAVPPAQTDAATPPVAGVEGATRLIAHPPERLLDTRAVERTSDAADRPWALALPPGRRAVVLSVVVAETTRAGTVLVDGRAGQIPVATAPGAGTTLTNLVVVPVAGSEATIWSTAGGELVVDLVGTFESSARSSSGRFQGVDRTTIARVESAVGSGELAIDPVIDPIVDPAGRRTGGVGPDQASAVLVEVRAEVLAGGGAVEIGPSADRAGQLLAWGSPAGGNGQRRALALLTLGEAGRPLLRYTGVAEVTVDVLGYFTSDSAPEATAGLYRPAAVGSTIDGRFAPGVPTEVARFDGGTSHALLVVDAPSATPGQLGTVLLPVIDQQLTLEVGGELRATVTVLGAFLAPEGPAGAEVLDRG